MKLAFLFLILSAGNVVQADIVRFYQVAPKLYRGGQPETYEDYQFLKKLKVKTIINLRAGGEGEEQVANRHGFNWLGFPMVAHRTPPDALVDAALAAMNDPKLQPVFVHCFHGKDRTGLMIALHRVLYQGWTPRSAYAEMINFDFNRIYLPLLYTFYKRTMRITPNLPREIPEPQEETHSPILQVVPAVVGN